MRKLILVAIAVVTVFSLMIVTGGAVYAEGEAGAEAWADGNVTTPDTDAWCNAYATGPDEAKAYAFADVTDDGIPGESNTEPNPPPADPNVTADADATAGYDDSYAHADADADAESGTATADADAVGLSGGYADADAKANAADGTADAEACATGQGGGYAGADAHATETNDGMATATANADADEGGIVFSNAIALAGDGTANSSSQADATSAALVTGGLAFDLVYDIEPGGVAIAWGFTNADCGLALTGSISVAALAGVTADATSAADSEGGVEVTADVVADLP